MWKKYYIYKEQISYDGGQTWEDTGNQTISGDPIGEYETEEECMANPVKAILTLSDGSRVEIPGIGELTSGETSGYSATCVSAEITTACTSIGDRVFYYYQSLTSVTIPNSVTSIGENAFRLCRSLTSVTIPDSVTSIGGSIFNRCFGLTSVTIGSGVTSISNSAFYICSGLTSVNIPDSVTVINDGAFYECSRLTSITIPDSVTSISGSAFDGCSSLTSVTIPDSVTSIGSVAFKNCSGLTSITVEATTPPTLGINAFLNTNNCPIYVPCESINAYKTAWSAYESRIQCKTEPFEGKARLTLNDGSEVIISGSGVLTSANTNSYKSRTVFVEIGTNCTGIGGDAFRSAGSITGITFENTITSIGYRSFYYCTGITSLELPNSLQTIGEQAFNGCSNLTSITIPSGVTSIGNIAFFNCSGLTEINVEAITPPTLGTHVFDSTNNCPIYVPCISLQTYKTAWSTYADRITCKGTIPTKARLTLNDGSIVEISGNGELTSAETMAYYDTTVSAETTTACTSIGDGAFSVTIWHPEQGVHEYHPFNKLSAITISNTVTSIGYRAFSSDGNLRSINIPGNVRSVGQMAFDSCASLTSVTFNEGLVTIATFAFYECKNLKSVNIPNSVKGIGGVAFAAHAESSGVTCSLTSITIGTGVVSIDVGAFGCLPCLTSLTINATTPPTLYEGTPILGGSDNCIIYVPAQSVNAYKTANYWSNYASRIVAIP